jgi:hypothetical protein
MTAQPKNTKPIRISRWNGGFRCQGQWDVSLRDLVGRLIELQLRPDEDCAYSCPDIRRYGVRAGASVRDFHRMLCMPSERFRRSSDQVLPLLHGVMECLSPGSTCLEEVLLGRRQRQRTGTFRLIQRSVHDLGVRDAISLAVARRAMLLVALHPADGSPALLTAGVSELIHATARGMILKYLPEAHDVVDQALSGYDACARMVATDGHRAEVAAVLADLLGEERWSSVEILFQIHNACRNEDDEPPF